MKKNIYTNAYTAYSYTKIPTEEEIRKEERIKKHFMVGGVYIPQLECSALSFNQSKLRNEERILDLILRRALGVKKKMGPESALEDMLAYLKKWKKDTHGWQKQSKEKLRELQITIEEGKNEKEKNNARTMQGVSQQIVPGTREI